MDEDNALDFYDRITKGTERYKTISLEHKSGAVLEDVRMHPVGKQKLAETIEKLPDEMFEAVEGAEDADVAEEELEEEGGDLSAVTGSTVDAFEDLIVNSLTHPELTETQMGDIIAELAFETLFELGTEVINMSVEDAGAIRGFHEQG